jgi:hypothetical protein
MAREQQERATRYIAAINDRRAIHDRRGARTATPPPGPPPPALLASPDPGPEIAAFAAMQTAGHLAERGGRPEVRRG